MKSCSLNELKIGELYLFDSSYDYFSVGLNIWKNQITIKIIIPNTPFMIVGIDSKIIGHYKRRFEILYENAIGYHWFPLNMENQKCFILLSQ